ncbi:hypothetical protein QAD02_022785 [Eretmocerus hayati]|uniref:Uncharacterized protein n=1 Tax=Eretmocerus hayati TaxID=131215 RepID=A0ACC2PTY6_9HYME|nr:hypothetical protein QAD02_022785 [Eretmocerus hayati]
MAFNKKCIILLYELTMLFLFVHVVATEDIILNINVKKPVAVVSDKFLSVTLDPAVFFSGNALSDMERSKSMAKALSPAYVRIGGPHSNSYTFERSLYAKEINTETGYTFSESQWVNVQQWAQQSGLDVVAVLAPQRSKSEKVGARASPWDPRNALDLISLSDHLGYNISWQLGYECQTRCDASGAELGRDVQRLRSMLNAFPRYTDRGIIVIGPDIVDFRSRQQQQFLQDYFHAARATLGAITWHPDFAGVTVETDGVSMHHDDLALERDSLYRIAGRHIFRKPLWIAESKPEECKRQFLGALVWARRLGNAAKLGIQVLMRQPDNSDLFRPTPDFWVSALHKMLVGQQVLETKMITGNRTNVHFYCHCTRPSSQYKKGSLTIFGVNLTPSRVSVNLKGLKLKAVHKYILMPGFDAPNRMFAETVLLNNEKLNLINGKKVPDLQPVISNTEKGVKLKLSSGGIGFWVLPDLDIKVCVDELNGDRNRDSSEESQSVSEEEESKEVFEIINSNEEEQRIRQHQQHPKKQSVHHSSTNRHRADEVDGRRSHKLVNQVHSHPGISDKVLQKRDHHAVSSQGINTGKVIEALTLITQVENAMKGLEKDYNSEEDRTSTSGLASRTDGAFEGRLNSYDNDNDRLLSKVLNTEESRRTLVPSTIEDQLHALYELLSDERLSPKRPSTLRPRRNLIRGSKSDSLSSDQNSIILHQNAKENKNSQDGLQRNLTVATEPAQMEQDNGENIVYLNTHHFQHDDSLIDETQKSDFSHDGIFLRDVERTNVSNHAQPLIKQLDSISNPSRDIRIAEGRVEVDNAGQTTTNSNQGVVDIPGITKPIHHRNESNIDKIAAGGNDSKNSVKTPSLEPADDMIVKQATQHQVIDEHMVFQEKQQKIDAPNHVQVPALQESHQPTPQYPQEEQIAQYQDASYRRQPIPYNHQQFTPSVVSIPLRRVAPKSDIPLDLQKLTIHEQGNAQRVKRHINSLEDIFHREMIAQDDNNLRDCQCRVIRGQQECRVCNMKMYEIYDKPGAIPPHQGYKHLFGNELTNKMRFRRDVSPQIEELSETITNGGISAPDISAEKNVNNYSELQQDSHPAAHEVDPEEQTEVLKEEGKIIERSITADLQEPITVPTITQDESTGLDLDFNSESTSSRLPRRTSPEIKTIRSKIQSTKSTKNATHAVVDVNQNVTGTDGEIPNDSDAEHARVGITPPGANGEKETKPILAADPVNDSPKTNEQIVKPSAIQESVKQSITPQPRENDPKTGEGQRFDLNKKFRNGSNTKDKKVDDKFAASKKSLVVEKNIKKVSKNAKQNSTQAGSLEVTGNQTKKDSGSTDDANSLKSRPVRLTTRAEVLAALKKENEKKRAKKMIETSLRQLDTESARFAEYQKRHQDQIEKLKARLRAKREKMLQQYKHELLEAIDKSPDSEERNLRRRDLLQILTESFGKDGSEIDSGKSTQILNYQPSERGAIRDVRESQRVLSTTDNEKPESKSPGEYTGEHHGFARRKRDTRAIDRSQEDSTRHQPKIIHKSVKKSLRSIKKFPKILRRPRSIEKLPSLLDKPESHIMYLGPRLTSTLTAKISAIPTHTHLIKQRNAHIPSKKCKRSCQDSMDNNLRSAENNEINRSGDDVDIDEILNDIVEMKESQKLLEEFDERRTEMRQNFEDSQRNFEEYLRSTENSSTAAHPGTVTKNLMATTAAGIESVLVETIPKLQIAVNSEMEKAKNFTGSLEDFLQTFEDQDSGVTETPETSSSTAVDGDERISQYVFKSMVNGVNKIFGIVSKFAKVFQAH